MFWLELSGAICPRSQCLWMCVWELCSVGSVCVRMSSYVPTAALMLLHPLHTTHTLHRYCNMQFSTRTVCTYMCACHSMSYQHMSQLLHPLGFLVAGPLCTTSGYPTPPSLSPSLSLSRVLLPVFISSLARLTESERDDKIVIGLTTDSSVKRVTEWFSLSDKLPFVAPWKKLLYSYHTLVFTSPTGLKSNLSHCVMLSFFKGVG